MVLEPAVKYKVTFQIPGVHRKPRQMVARFLTKQGEELVFSGRPVFGTTQLRETYVLEAEAVDPETPCDWPEIVR